MREREWKRDTDTERQKDIKLKRRVENGSYIWEEFDGVVGHEHDRNKSHACLKSSWINKNITLNSVGW